MNEEIIGIEVSGEVYPIKNPIDDTTTSTTETWSSKKINNSLKNLVGDLSELKTTDKSNVVGAINEIATLNGYKIRTGTVTVSTDNTGWFSIPTGVKNSKTKYCQLTAITLPYLLSHNTDNGYARRLDTMALLGNTSISANYIAFDSID